MHIKKYPCHYPHLDNAIGWHDGRRLSHKHKPKLGRHGAAAARRCTALLLLEERVAHWRRLRQIRTIVQVRLCQPNLSTYDMYVYKQKAMRR